MFGCRSISGGQQVSDVAKCRDEVLKSGGISVSVDDLGLVEEVGESFGEGEGVEGSLQVIRQIKRAAGEGGSRGGK